MGSTGTYPTAPGSPAQLVPGSPTDEVRNNRISFTGSVSASPSIPFGLPPGSPRSSTFSPTSSTGSRDVKDLHNDVIVKILLLGDSGTGKSQLFHRLRTQKFNPIPLPTPGIDVTTHRIKIADGSTMKAQIFDTSGLEKYRTIVQNYWNLAHGAMVVYDVSSRESFNNMRRWVRDFKAKVSGQQAKRPESPQTSNGGTASDSELRDRKGPLIMIVGNKTDLGEYSREVSTADGRAYATAHGFIFMETSAQDDTNVELAFNILLTEAYHSEKDRLESAKLRIAEEERKNDEGAAGLVNNLIRKLSERRTIRGDSGKDLREKRYSTSPPPRGARSNSIGASESRESSDDNTTASIILGNGVLVPPRKASLMPVPLDGDSNVGVTFLESLDAGAKTLWNWVGEVATAIADETRDSDDDEEYDEDVYGRGRRRESVPTIMRTQPTIKEASDGRLSPEFIRPKRVSSLHHAYIGNDGVPLSPTMSVGSAESNGCTGSNQLMSLPPRRASLKDPSAQLRGPSPTGRRSPMLPIISESERREKGGIIGGVDYGNRL
ncbi:P-loop containing nucleoside triphosphate hydrolase protein [Cladochytrium replicatum]|nr:P-loop containing nucleoside triphosphate hydrolase protein [Cladochytrium replicatum]